MWLLAVVLKASELRTMEPKTGEFKARDRVVHSFSSVGSSQASNILQAFDIHYCDGNWHYPIELESSTPQCLPFDDYNFASENYWTPALLRHHKEQLRKFGINFGLNGFGMCMIFAAMSIHIQLSTMVKNIMVVWMAALHIWHHDTFCSVSA